MWRSYNQNSLIIAIISALSIVYPFFDTWATKAVHIPCFMSIKASEVNLRSGPGAQYPVRITYKSKYYPLEVTAEFDHWRLVRDDIGNQGWVHQNLLSKSRYVVFKKNIILDEKLKAKFNKKNEALVFRLPDENSYPVLRVELGVVARIKKCIDKWCQLELTKKSVWSLKSNLWGVYQNELFDQ